MKSRTKIIWVFGLALFVGATPLAIYPAVLFADLCSLGDSGGPDRPLLLSCTKFLFQVGSLAYPLVYLGSAIPGLFLIAEKRGGRALACAFIPIGFIILLEVLLGLWEFLERLWIP